MKKYPVLFLLFFSAQLMADELPYNFKGFETDTSLGTFVVPGTKGPLDRVVCASQRIGYITGLVYTASFLKADGSDVQKRYVVPIQPALSALPTQKFVTDKIEAHILTTDIVTLYNAEKTKGIYCPRDSFGLSGTKINIP